MNDELTSPSLIDELVSTVAPLVVIGFLTYLCEAIVENVARSHPGALLVAFLLVAWRAQTWERPIWPLRPATCGVSP